MGAKTPEQVNKPNNRPRSTVKCDICGRKFLNLTALKSHHKFLHLKGETAKRVPFKKQEDAKQKKRVVPVNMLKRVYPSPATKQGNKTAVPEIPEKSKSPNLAGKPASVSRKPEFECPICAERFPVYFTAFRHIQKNHCIDENGEKVPPNSSQLVKPIRIEMCASCNQQIRSTEPHCCPKQTNKDQFFCLGCEQVFTSLVLFQHHVKGLHSNGAQNYFFPSRDEFTSWKTDLQEQTNIEFIRLNKQKEKEIYHCSHQPTAVSSSTKLCPATIIVREYTKGVHACYFKEHCGHTVDNVPTPNQYCISLYTRELEELKLEAQDDNDMYSQFKKMITCIVFDASKVDIATLKELLGKALEMTSVLKHYQGEDRSVSLISKSLTDKQISKSLDSLKQNPRKRSVSPEEKTPKRAVKRVRKPTKAFENGMATRLSKSSPAANKSVSFTKSVLKKDEELPPKEIEETPESNIQETPQKSLPKKTEEPKSLLKKAEEPQKTVPKKVEETEIKKVEEPPTPVTRSLLQSPTSFNDSYKNFVDQNFKCQTETSTPKTKANVKKKEIVKTKMGQFKVKPSVSPKAMSPKSPKEVKLVKEVVKVPTTPKVWKAIPDIRYEVKEQENDCNILILKI